MMDLIKKTLLTGIGIAYLTSEKIEELGKKLAKEAEVSREEGEKFIKDLRQQSEKARDRFKKQVKETVRKTLLELNLPSREEHDNLKKEIVTLKRRLTLLEKDINKEG